MIFSTFVRTDKVVYKIVLDLVIIDSSERLAKGTLYHSHMASVVAKT
jgi:hypothetical protein